MEIARFIYQENPNYEVDFEPSGLDNVMVNATQMAAIFGKQVIAFTRNDDTKNFISSCLKSENSHFLGIKNQSDLLTSKQKSGTWMHRILALKFAAWLDSDFEVWVYITIDKMLNQSFREEKEARRRKLQAKAEMANLKRELIKLYPEAYRYFDLEDTVRQADQEIIKSVKEQVKQLSFNFQFNTN